MVDYQLQKYYNFRVKALTHAQVEEMAAQVQTIADEHLLTDDASTAPEDERRLGKREDHDTLPDEVKAKYVENLSLLQRMRELHLNVAHNVFQLLLIRFSNVCASCICAYARFRSKTRPARTPSVIRS